MCSTMGRAAVIALGGLWLIFGSACSNSPDAQSTCDAYARVFADVAANTCKRGTFDSNLAAFKASARVGSDCQLVQSIRDQPALENECYPWLRDQLPQDCSLLDSPDRYVEAPPDACKGQLELVP